MKFRAPLCLLMIALPVTLMAASATPAPTTPRVFPLRRWMRALGMEKTPTDMKATGFRGLEIGLKVDPPMVKVGDVKQVKVTVTLINRGKKIVQLDFPTSQRIEVLVKSKEGKTLEQWSEDQAFNNEPTLVAVNPGERLEYPVSVATRDMVVGETYTVEAFFPNFDQLRTSLPVAAVKEIPVATPSGKPGKPPKPDKSAPVTPVPDKAEPPKPAK